MGFEAKFNHDYAFYTMPGVTPFQLLIQRLADPTMTDEAVATSFGRTRPAVYKWRREIDKLKKVLLAENTTPQP